MCAPQLVGGAKDHSLGACSCQALCASITSVTTKEASATGLCTAAMSSPPCSNVRPAASFIAHVQVLRIEREMEEVTVFYRPNTMRAEELSRNPVANALAVTFLMQSEQVPTRLHIAHFYPLQLDLVALAVNATRMLCMRVLRPLDRVIRSAKLKPGSCLPSHHVGCQGLEQAHA